MSGLSHPSPNYDDRRGAAVTHLILHYTGMPTAGAAIARLCDPDAKVSAHYTVDEDGSIYSHVSETDRAWHAGVSSWKGEGDLNTRSIGIEIVNPGHEFGYRLFPDAQIRAVSDLCLAVMARHRILPENVLAHSDVAPDRKEDPGELFPWKMMAQQGVGVWPLENDSDVAPDVDAALIALGYDKAASEEKRLLAFQRHYEPELFETGRSGQPGPKTASRIQALLSGRRLISKQTV